jgi:hypothetical protein
MKTVKTLIVIACSVAFVGHAQASTVTGQNTVSSDSQAAAQNTASPTQTLQQNGARAVANAPVVQVGGSIGTHLCEGGAGVSGGFFTWALGGGITLTQKYCVFMNVTDFLQQSATMEDKAGNADLAASLRQSSYDLTAEIDPVVRAVLSRNHVLKGDAAVQSDASGTVGLQPASLRVQ